MRHAITPTSPATQRRYVAPGTLSLGAVLDLQGAGGVLLASGAALFVALVVTSNGRLLGLLTAALFLVVAVSLKPDVFLAVALVTVGLSSVIQTYAFSIGPATVYPLDMLVALALVRSLRPADRFPPSRLIGSTVLLVASVWGVLMAIAGIRAFNAGASLDTIIRYETALLYFPALYFSFSRMLREKALDLARLWRLLICVSVGFVAWMFVMRLLNHPFENAGNGGIQLGTVVTSSGSVVRRDFGSATAFIIYPALALAGVAGMVYSTRTRASTVLATIGIVATFVTLIRSEIFGMLLGIAAILALDTRGARNSRVVTAGILAGGAVASLLALAYINPHVRDAIVQRTLPGVATESKTANQTAEYRMKALQLGTTVASDHPGGIGFRDVQVLQGSHIDPQYLGHSTPAWLLVFTGWFGLAAAAAALVALFTRSFRAPALAAWMHPAFIGIVLLLLVYSFGADGLVGQSWVITLTALAIALRFSLSRPPA